MKIFLKLYINPLNTISIVTLVLIYVSRYNNNYYPTSYLLNNIQF